MLVVDYTAVFSELTGSVGLAPYRHVGFYWPSVYVELLRCVQRTCGTSATIRCSCRQC